MLNQAIPLLEREKSQHETLFAYVHRGMAQTCLGHYPAGLSDVNRTLEIACSSQDQNAEVMARDRSHIHSSLGRRVCGRDRQRA